MRDFDKLSKRRQERITKKAERAGLTVDAFRKGRREKWRKVAVAILKLLKKGAALTPTSVDDEVIEKILDLLEDGEADEA